MSRENVEVVRRLWEAWGRGDMEAVFALYDPDIVWDQTGSEVPGLGVFHGHQGVRDFFRQWMEPFDDYYARPEEFLDAGDSVVVRVRQGGRGKGSGVAVEMPAYWHVFRIQDGRVVRSETYQDRAEALESVGLRE